MDITFVKATIPPLPKNQRAVRAGIIYAGILVVFVVSQLFSFEEFLEIVRDFGLPGATPGAYSLATLVVTAEVFALPFLLRMQLSAGMRYVSMVTGWLVAFFWIFITLWLVVTSSTVINVGMFGDIIAVASGWLSVLFSLGLGALSVYVSRGMWPIAEKK
jgi:hypothetical protein